MSRWTDQEIEILRSNHNDGNNAEEIQLELSDEGFDRTVRAIKDKVAEVCPRDITQVTTPSTFDPPEEEIETVSTWKIDQVWKSIRKLKEKYEDDAAINVTGLDCGPASRRVLHMTDWHIPFERQELIKKIIDSEGDKDTDLVIGGDFLDCYTPSSWPKDKYVPLKKEYDIGLEYLKILSSKFRKVWMIMGNHEYRINKLFIKSVEPGNSFFLNKSILHHLAEGNMYDDNGELVGKVDLPNVKYIGGGEPWYLILGRMVFAHPYFFKSGTGNTVKEALKYFGQRASFDGIAIGHTHTCSKQVYGYKLAIETPCLALPLDYEKQPRMTYLPQTNGYAEIFLDKEGRVDYNKSRPIYMGSNYFKKYSIGVN